MMPEAGTPYIHISIRAHVNKKNELIIISVSHSCWGQIPCSFVLFRCAKGIE